MTTTTRRDTVPEQNATETREQAAARHLYVVALTWTSMICHLSPTTLTPRMSVRSSPSRVSARAQLWRASIETTQCPPADLIIFVSTTEAVFARCASQSGRLGAA
jgi:hypothetical protein